MPVPEKEAVTKVCIDDFAFRKRKTYGTIMADIDTHRIIDLLASRESADVAEWLKSYLNLEVVSRGMVLFPIKAPLNRLEAICSRSVTVFTW